MFNLNKVILFGNLTADAVISTMSGNKKVANFKIAINRNYQKADGNWEKETTFLNCVQYSPSDNLCQSLKLGKPVAVEGRIRNRNFDKTDGTGKVYITEIVAERTGILSKSEKGEESEVVTEETPAAQFVEDEAWN